MAQSLKKNGNPNSAHEKPEVDDPSNVAPPNGGGSHDGGSGSERPDSDGSPEEKMVSMRFRKDTIENVNYLKRATGIDNRTQLTADAIALAAWFVKRQQNGGRIYVEYEDGEREAVFMPRF
jgi:hypothetical protein